MQDHSCYQVLVWFQWAIEQQRPLSYDKTNTLQDARPIHASLQRRGIGAATLRVFERKVLHKILGTKRIGDDFRIRSNIGFYETDVVQHINNRGCAGSAMSFEWKRILWQDCYLMQGSAEFGKEDDLVSVGRTKSGCVHWCVDAQEFEECIAAGLNPLIGLFK